MNKMYKVIWNNFLNAWVAVSELAKGNKKTKNSFCIENRTNNSVHLDQSKTQKTNCIFKINAFLIAIFSIFGTASAYALTPAECGAMGSSCTVVSTAAQLSAALGNGAGNSATTIVLANDITLSGNIAVNMAGTNRQNIIIDGGGFTLNTGTATFNLNNQANAGWEGNGSLSFTNLAALNSSTAGGNTVVSMDPGTTAVDVIFDNIGSLTNSMYAVIGNIGSGGTPNLKSQLVFGDIAAPINLTYGTNHQLAQAANVKFTGRFDLTAPGTAGAYNTVFWSNAANQYNKMTFSSTADVSIAATYLTLGSNANNNAYMYFLDDGARLSLKTPQNVFGVTNNGLQIGSYDASSGFGAGAVVKLADYNGGLLAGDGISNLGGGNSGGLGNGFAQAGNVVFNLASGSELNTSGAANSAIRATKNSGVNSNIYISSGATINAAGASGITASHSGTGDVIVENKADGVITATTGISLTHNGNGTASLANHGVINSTTTGIAVNSSSAKQIIVDGTGGTINAINGAGVNVLGNASLVLTGGEIKTSNTANGINIVASNTGSHQISDATITIGGTGSAISKNDGASLSLSNTQINIANGIGFNNLSNINFAASASGRNKINVTGSGTAISTSNSVLNGWAPEELDLNISGAGTGINVTGGGVNIDSANLVINVTDTNGTGLVIADGANNNTTIGANTQINALGATAIKFEGTSGKNLNNQGSISGGIVFNNNAANTITNNGTLNGTLVTGSGLHLHLL